MRVQYAPITRAVSAATVAMFLAVGTVSAQTLAEQWGFQPGATETAVVTGTYEDLISGDTGSFGPFVETCRVESTNRTIIDHTATMVERCGDGSPQNSAFFMSDDTGVRLISDGDPTLGGWYEYYEDPKLSIPSSWAEGETIVTNGSWRGQWENNGGFEAWEGTYTESMTWKPGTTSITTPWGTFDAIEFESHEEFTQSSLASSGFNRGKVLTVSWFVDGIGFLGGTDIWESFSDWDGNGLWDFAEKTTFHYSLIPFDPAPGDVFDTQFLASGAYTSSGSATQDAVVAALAEVVDSATTVPLSVSQPAGGIGLLAGVTVLAADDVDTLIDAMIADGASVETAFLRMEFHYDLDLLIAAGIDEADLAPYWWDDDVEKWLLVGTTIAGEIGAGLLATLPEHEFRVGYYGVDTAQSLVWANVNHASFYGLLAFDSVPVPVPLPPAVLLFGFAFSALGFCRRLSA